MHKLTPMAFLACLTFALVLVLAPAFGQNQEEHAAHHPGDKPAAAAPVQPNAEQSKDAATMRQMQDNMKKMHELMARIESSHDPKERRTLSQQHLQAMHAQMEMMHGMCCGMTMGMMDRGANAGTDRKGPMKGGMSDDMMKHHRMMQERMDMMQMMMQQMIQHELVEQGGATGK